MIDSPLLPLLFLIGSTTLVTIKTALHRLSGEALKEFIHSHRFSCFLMRHLANIGNRAHEKSKILSFVSISTQITRIAYGVTTTIYVLISPLAQQGLLIHNQHLDIVPKYFWSLLALIIFVSLIIDFLFRFIAFRQPYAMLKIFSAPASLYLGALFPITYVLIAIQDYISLKNIDEEIPSSHTTIKKRLADVLNEREMAAGLDIQDKKLILSIASFRERLAKEVKVPRPGIVSLSDDTTILEASKTFIEEEFSRIPVYKETLDQVVGVLRIKDLFAFVIDHLHQSEKLTSTSIATLIKSVLFTPETKRISSILQDFKKHHSHMAIVVDEYGGTEGLITLEDILEEIVGEIHDEYDFDEEKLYKEAGEDAYIVDARMSIIDIDTQLGISIPLSKEYDSIGGFVYYQTNSIPKTGSILYQDEFTIEVIASSPRKLITLLIKKVSPQATY